MTSDSSWSTKMSFVFGLCAFLGILLLIFSEVGLAQPQGNGFRPGTAPIGNPINDPDFEEEEDDFEEFDEADDGAPMRRGQNPFQNQNPGIVPPPPPPSQPPSSGGISVGGAQDDRPLPELKRGRKGTLELSGPGTEQGIKTKNEVPVLPVDNESGEGDPASSELITDFNFPDANILDIAKTLGRLTGKNFILDKDVKGTVSIISNSPITVSDAWRAFLTSLDMNGLAIVPTGKYLRIMRQNDAKAKNVRLYSNTKAPNTDALVTKIFKIKYISAKELENVVRTYTNMGARIYGFEQTNTLIITDTGSNIDKVAKMIQFLDVEGFDAGIEVIAVKHASAVEIQKLIDSLLPGMQANFPSRPGFAGRPGAASNFAARRTKQGGLINNIIADERTNTLIVHANPRGVGQVRELIQRLDRKLPAVLGGGKVHVVYLQFADSEEMAKTLNNFSQTTGPGSRPMGAPGGPIGGIGVNPNESNLFEGQIKISADKTTNSLVITASPSDFATIQRVINKLDIPRNQVFVEVVIMEMNMERTNDWSANVLLPKGTSVAPTNDLFRAIQNPLDVGNGLVLRFAEGENTLKINTGGTTQELKIPNVAALVKAIQTYSGGNVLATPQLMTLDNQEATFDSSDQIPIPQINNAGLGIQTASVTYKDVPLTVKIKPQMNKISNFIKLDIKAKASDVSNRAVPRAVQDQAQALQSRSLETSVMVADTDTVVLGGLVRDRTSEVINKVPLLGDIPILGWLFKSRSAQVSKMNLMLFITPKIIREPENVRMVLDRKLKERDEFVEKAFGGEDAHRDVRNRIIRQLPDIKTIKNYSTKRVLNLDEDEEPTNNPQNDGGNTSNEQAPGAIPSADTRDTLTLPAAEPPPTAPQAAATPASIPAPVTVPPRENPQVARPETPNDTANGVPSGEDPFALPVPPGEATQ